MAESFNPCFNGTMYKNKRLCRNGFNGNNVSILVLMELCIKTDFWRVCLMPNSCFNPCFNGTMYKNMTEN